MKRKIAILIGAAALLSATLALSPPLGAAGIEGAQAAVSKSLDAGGAGGNVAGAGDRLGGLLSKIGAPIVIAVAGFFLLGSLASRNIGASVGVVLITVVALIFLLSPQSIESLSKGLADTVF